MLYIWYRFLQPIFLKIWNPFGTVTNKPNETNNAADNSTKETEDKDCPGANSSTAGLKCPFSSKDSTKVD